MQTQKDVDTKTFGSVAATYKSRHINRQTQNRGNRNYNQQNQNQNRYNRNYNQQRYNNNYNTNYQNRNQGNYTTNKWVPRR